MNTELFRRVQDVYGRVAGLPDAQRRAAIDRECAGNEALRHEVESLLAFASPPDDFMESGALAEAAAFERLDSLEGRVLGSYRIDRRIASGGMGAVYAATRTLGQGSDEVAQLVAFKVVKRGMDSEEIVRRFRQERRTLARLGHPSIAALLDGGVLPDGRPYLVMEYVDGAPIDQACDERGLGIEARLRLFRDVCRAVHFAHQNLVVHRDLKPGNILVTADGAPKLLDFGIAKVLDTPGGATGEVTAAEQRRLTPEYASPEQVKGGVVTTASDVYSLGVILYVLLTGRRPYEFPDRSSEGVERVVCMEEPRAPSAASGTPGATARALRGDLDNIVLKALFKDPARRYASAEQLADDIDRYLAGLPVSARSPTVRYYATKFVRRHAAASTAVAVAVVGLLAVGVAIAVQNRRVIRERDEANLARDQAEKVVEVFNDALATTDPERQVEGVTVKEAMDELRDELPRLTNQPLVRATLAHTIGLSYLRMGRLDDAEPLLEEAYRERSGRLGKDDHDIAESHSGLGELAFAHNRYDLAEREFREALRISGIVADGPSEDQAQALNDLGVTVRALGRFDEARQLMEESLRVRESLESRDELKVAETWNNLANVYRNLKRPTDATAAMEKARALREKLLKPDHILMIQTLNNLASLAITDGRYAEAETLLRRAIPLEEKKLGPDNIRHAGTLANLGRVCNDTGRFEEAEALYRSALAIRVPKLPADAPALVTTRLGLVQALAGQRDFEQAETVLKEADSAGAALSPEARTQLRDTGEKLYSSWGKDEAARAWAATHGG